VTPNEREGGGRASRLRVAALLACLLAARLADAADEGWVVLAEDDPNGAAYVDKVRALLAAHAGDFARTYREAHERSPCARAELTLSLLVKPNGTIADAVSEPSPPLPDDVGAAIAAIVKTLKLPPPPGAQPTRLRVPVGPIPPAPPAPALSCGAELLDRGRYIVSELVPGTDKGAWLALCRQGGDAVRSVQIQLKRFRSEASNDDKHEKTGREVSVKGCEGPAFLFRGVQTAKEGPVAAAKVTAKTDGWNSAFDIAQGGVAYHLRLQAKSPSPGAKDEPEERPWKLLLEREGAVDEIDRGQSANAPALSVRWAGDLDGDGRPDFVLEDRSDGVSLQLFLSGSSAADAHDHKVRAVAATSWGSS
jgi:hypothetical protein